MNVQVFKFWTTRHAVHDRLKIGPLCCLVVNTRTCRALDGLDRTEASLHRIAVRSRPLKSPWFSLGRVALSCVLACTGGCARGTDYRDFELESRAKKQLQLPQMQIIQISPGLSRMTQKQVVLFDKKCLKLSSGCVSLSRKKMNCDLLQVTISKERQQLKLSCRQGMLIS